MHVDVTDEEVNTGDFYWGKSAALDSLLNKYFAFIKNQKSFFVPDPPKTLCRDQGVCIAQSKHI